MVAAIPGLFLAFGIAMELVVRALDRRLPSADEADRGTRVLYCAVTVLGVVLVALFVPFALFTRNVCGCDPPIVASSSAALAGVGTALWWIAQASRTDTSVAAKLARILGYAGLAGVLVFGLARAGSDAADILAR